MKPITIDEIVKATNGRLLFGDPDAKVTGVVHDSRQAKEGDLFVPIIGAKVDAHCYIPDVLAAGATCVLSSEENIEEGKGACVLVEDTIKALQMLAGWYRDQFDIPVVGVTGSVGKTSTKEMIGTVLSKKYNTLITYKNLNSQIGLPLMVFHIEEDTEVAVLEMGVSLFDEMDALVEVAKPSSAVITNIGLAHIGNFKTRENICAQKGRIIKEFGDDGRIFACANGDLYDLIRTNLPYDCCKGECRVSFYGIKDDIKTDMSQISSYASDIRVENGREKFTYHHGDEQIDVSLAVMGDHNVTNAVVAIAVGRMLGVSLEDAAKAVGEYEPLSMRGEIHHTKGMHIIDDTYNASPDSIRSNLRALFSHEGNGRRIAVLGDVLELGEMSAELHKSIGAYIVNEAKAGRRLDAVYCVGKESKEIIRFLQANSDIECYGYDDNFSLIKALKNDLKEEDWVIMKASRGMHLDDVVKAVI
ncbi:MAG: UDP-N-acetylmuramoyl-tripeptide--D-alanyl-D-alanine ligase [Eubacterium sp.]|nr:UDP-N-acetylmuramoyl-tripeptide--D-alanyl-D-alanine ligase [Eubacterium sp.]